MAEKKKRTVYVVGHKNPDTDSICSAIALANLKNEIMKSHKRSGSLTSASYVESLPANVVYKPVRAGHINLETRYVLDTFGFDKPEYMTDARTQVCDIEYSTAESVNDGLSLRDAWKLMGQIHKSTLAVTDDAGHLTGVITMGDIARSYMAVFDNEILGVAKTPYKNVVETLDGELIVGDIEETITSGKVLIAAGKTGVLETMTDKGDVLILGNRYEAQLCAIEHGAAMMIICDGAAVSRTIRRIAEANGCAILSTSYDPYAAARLITQSMPISHFMCTNLIKFNENDYLNDIKGTITKERFRDFPIVNDDDIYLGTISRRNLLTLERKKFVLVDHNEENQAMNGIQEAEIIELVDHHKLGTMETVKPVQVRNMPVGCTATIIYQMYMENDIEITPKIAGLLCSAIISDTLLFRSPTCTPLDKIVCQALAEIAGVDPEKHAMAMFDAGSDLKSKSIDEIFYMDFKKFKAGDITFGVGQITSMNVADLGEVKEKMKEYLVDALAKEGTDMLFFLFTDILSENSWTVYAGKDAEETLAQGFGKKPENKEFLLNGVVSRKKQFVPVMMEQLTM